MDDLSMANLYGLDVSNHQGPPAAYRDQDWYQQAQFVIAQAIPRPTLNGYTGEQLRAAKADGKYAGAYFWLWHDPSWRMGGSSVEDDMRHRLATVPDDVQLDMRVWLDVEDNQSSGWNTVTVSQRVDDVNRALAVLDEWSYARGLPEAGIYWSDYFVALLFKGVDYFGRKQWKAHYSMPAGSLIGGQCVAHQYTSTPIDKNMMLGSEIITVPETDETAERIRGLEIALAYVCDVQGDAIWNRTRSPAIRANVTEMRRVREQFLGPRL